MQFRPPGKLRVGIDLAPLVDVVFLLVIFFAVSTTFLETSGLKLDLPRSSATADRQPREIAVYLTAEGQIAFRNEQVDLAALEERLRKAFAAAQRRAVVLRADAGTPHGRVVEVMDAIRLAGAESLTVATRAKPR